MLFQAAPVSSQSRGTGASPELRSPAACPTDAAQRDRRLEQEFNVTLIETAPATTACRSGRRTAHRLGQARVRRTGRVQGPGRPACSTSLHPNTATPCRPHGVHDLSTSPSPRSARATHWPRCRSGPGCRRKLHRQAPGLRAGRSNRPLRPGDRSFSSTSPSTSKRYMLLICNNRFVTVRHRDLSRRGGPLALLTPDMRIQQIVDTMFAERVRGRPTGQTETIASSRHVGGGGWASVARTPGCAPCP